MICWFYCRRRNGSHSELWEAAANGQQDTVQRLLAETPHLDIDQPLGEDDDTALHQACAHGHVHIVRILLHHGANVQAKNVQGKTPLAMASDRGQTEVVEFLVDHLIKMEGQFEEKTCGGSTPLALACYHGHAPVARILLNHGAHLHEKDDYGRTPLTQASYRGQTEVTELLLEKGANVNDQDTDGLTALALASANGHVDVALLLLRHGALVDARDQDGLTPLHHAVICGQAGAVQLLLNHGAAHDATTLKGWTALHYATVHYHRGETVMTTILRIVEEKFGADALPSFLEIKTHSQEKAESESGDETEAEDDSKSVDESVDESKAGGETALHIAARYDHHESVKVLLQAGADHGSRTTVHQSTPLHLACQSYHWKTMKLLWEAGADRGAVDANGRIPWKRLPAWMRKDIQKGRAIRGYDYDFVPKLLEWLKP